MTNTKQLKGAVALLASIAVLDNFIFVELEPGFDSMVLIETSGSQSEAETAKTSENPSPRNKTEDFWIDQHKVSNADFAVFLESTGYEQQSISANIGLEISNKKGDLAVILASEKWRNQVGNTDWSPPTTNDNTPKHNDLSSPQELKVSIKDASAYCHWLGKELPTEKQFNFLTAADQDKSSLHSEMVINHHWQVEERKTAIVGYDSSSHDQASHKLAEFRCVKNI